MASSLSSPATASSESSISCAFLGNSIIYFNDCPRLLQHMLSTQYSQVRQDSCLRGGTSLPTLFEKGNGMRNKFGSEAAVRDDGSRDIGKPTVASLLTGQLWDYVVMNDYTQAPTRPESRDASIESLKTNYGPLFNKSSCRVVFLQTFAYRKPNIKDTQDLGTVDEFTTTLREGYEAYVSALKDCCKKEPYIAPVGDAFLWMYHFDKTMWKRLFYIDDFHPSPHGTWYEACVIFCTIVGRAPPLYQFDWWKTARYMQPPNDEQLPLPTNEEAEFLRQSACTVCNIDL